MGRFVDLPQGENKCPRTTQILFVQASGSSIFCETEARMGILLLVALLLLLFGIVGGIAFSKFLFLILIVALVVAAIGFFSRRTA
jgi:hypothetical protein